MAERIRVLVVDDSHFTCKAITRIIQADPTLEVIGVAHDGRAALEAIGNLAPDVVTMDVEMPVMDGLEVLRRLSSGPEDPPVIILSGMTRDGSKCAVEALELGAFDLVPKPERLTEVFGIATELQAKIRAAHGARRKKRRTRPRGPAGAIPVPARDPAKNAEHAAEGSAHEGVLPVEIVVVGVSTGGPGTLQTLVSHIPADFPIPIVVAQHMPRGFTRSLAERLNTVSYAEVREAMAGDLVLPGTILVAPAGWHLVFDSTDEAIRVKLLEDTGAFSWYRPSVDVLFESAAATYGSRVLALVLTGLGNDGTKGAAAVKAAGGILWAQDEDTSVVYGMPRSVKEAGLVDRVLALPAIGPALRRLGSKGVSTPVAGRAR